MAVNLETSHGFAIVQRIAGMLSMSTLVPKEYQGKQNLSNCIIALNMAYRLGADPLMVIQNLYVVHGRPGWSSQFLIATFNKSGRFSALRYEFVGTRGQDSWGCFAYATELSTGEVLQGTTVTLGTAKAEGWLSKNGSKWGTMPEQMLRYRAASWFIRAYAPEIAMGLLTAEEVHDTYDATPDKSGTYSLDLNELVVPMNQADLPGTVIGPDESEPLVDIPDSLPPRAEWEKKNAPAAGAPFDLEPQAPAPEPAPPAGTGEKKNGRAKAAELDDMREALGLEIAEKGVSLSVVEKAVGEFQNRWSLKDMERIKNFIVPNLMGEKRG
jgi:hypothetical protein